MKTSDFDYDLPPGCIAQTPVEPRDTSRLLVLYRKTGLVEHRIFRDVQAYVRPGDVLVINQTRVIPARLFGRKVPGGGKVEILLLKRLDNLRWEALVGGKGLTKGKQLQVEAIKPGDRAPMAEIEMELEGAERVVAEIENKRGKAIAVQADVAKQKDIERLFAETRKAFGKLDILINNAGIYEFSPLEGVTGEHFHKQFDLDVLGLVLTSQEAVKYFDGEGGSIVNISSLASTLTPPNESVYSAAKAAVDAVTKSLAKELATEGVLVNAVTPAAARTAMFDQMAPQHIGYMLGKIPMGRFVEPAEIAALVCWLSSEDCSFSTGAVFDISGGRATY